MYHSFFNLTCSPFQLTSDPAFLFMSRGHKKVLDYLTYGISEGNTGFILLTGEVGTGKTTLVRSLLRAGEGEQVRFARIDNTKVTSEQLITMISDDFGLETKGKDKAQLLIGLTEFLIAEFSRGKRPMLIIDEAQNLSPDMLEEVRLLSNLETDTAKLLQILLVGQPELRTTLALPQLRQLRQRITISCHLQPLGRAETEAYLLHRLEVAGNRRALTFEKDAIELIYTFSKGVPRLINVICDFIMLSAFIEKTATVSRELVSELTGQIEAENGYWQDRRTEQIPAPASADSAPLLGDLLARLEKLEIQAGTIERALLSLRDPSARLKTLEHELAALGTRVAEIERSRSLPAKGKVKKRQWWRLFDKKAAELRLAAGTAAGTKRTNTP